ncbi:DoxX family protein [Flammeovirga agarivorans]|uniref:DoxX family protein n=1 Tax=Flammeovirga agarivorans TaxID=2726742 RepID=A0A7X8SGK1_9BACT|nr:DoxX family protein [Flammeovirga agarivorans]NLR89826.1 DoxX family protein [Flammeovirga agarivorans]
MNKKLLFRIITGLFTALMLMSASMYIFQYDEVAAPAFVKLGFPTFIIYPLAVAKVLGLVAIWANLSKKLTEWAYAGFTFNTLLAIGAHINIHDNEYYAALVGFLLITSSYYLYTQLEEAKNDNSVPVVQS